jgi:farnesyl diphosphate synthase
VSFQDDLKRDAARIGDVLSAEWAGLPKGAITEGMAYATNGGKRLRGFLAMRSAALFDAPRDGHLLAAAAIECLHAYSLVHDDLPCMDDDDLRRGQPTVHKKWDDATAVLVGDALQSYAFELLTREDVHPDPMVRVDLVRSLAQASGAEGMVLGQALDIQAETAKTSLALDEITRLQAGKTGALIEWSVMVGARMSGRDPEPMKAYGQALGLAFQIADDILDVTGDEAKAGKRLQKDDAAGKATFVSLLGLDGAKARARELVAEALHILQPYDAKADPLRDAARFVISREL